jgi:serine phosphatase RsbU (regulator of sigma subunit)
VNAEFAPAEPARATQSVSLRGGGPARFADASAGFGNLPTADAGAAMNPGALRGGAQGRELDSLAHTLFLRIYPVIGAVLLVTQCAIAFLNYSDTTRIRTEQAQSLAHLAAAAIAKPGWASDPASARTLQAVASEPGVRRAVLRDAGGRVVAAAGEEIGPRAQGVLSVSAEIASARADAPDGTLLLTVSGENLRSFAQQQALMTIGAILVLMLAFVVTLQVNVRRHVLAPLQRLLAAMGQVERKSWTLVDPEGAFRPSNEIDSVCLAFNRMVAGLQSGDEAKELLARLEEAHGQLEAANQLVMESIGYARRLQTSTLPAADALATSGLDVAVLWEPLHLVGGDYYWMEEFEDVSVLVVADCTGHGVPGAFITLIVAMALDQILHHDKLRSPAAILAALDTLVRARLRQDGRGATSDDGLDCGICVWKRDTREIVFSGAGQSLIYLRDGTAERVRGGRHGIGYARREGGTLEFDEVAIPVDAETCLYLMTDGVTDQMAGTGREKRKLLGYKGLADILLRHRDKPLSGQLDALRTELAAYRGTEKARDDMTVVAFKPLAGRD